MEARKSTILAALFYPFSIATIAAGFLAFVMIVLKVDLLTISTVVLWFYFACAASIYFISERALKAFGFRGLFLGFTITIGVLAVLSAVLFVLGKFGTS
ncbi:MAG: hypothetical protein OEX16_00460 [Hadesarchaea archaeon]|nr:hypothetical protein [Hadesarchaea archaeon]MDH5685027.1 hypothetical protein [Hadesarchaea archaeon]